MKSKFLSITLAIVASFTISAMAQTGSTAAPPSTPSASASNPASSAPATAPVVTGPGKVGTINIQEAIFASNEGQKDMDGLQKKYEPKQAELKGQNDELESLKKQLSTQGDKLNDDAKASLQKQIESKQKTFERNMQDAREEVDNQQQEVAGKILNKMAPLIMKYAQDNGYTMIIDTSKPWPQSPVLWWNIASIDITKNVVDAYNVQSGVAAPAPTGTGAKPPARAPGATTPKPTAPAPKPSEPPKQ